jgi:NAD+ synthase
MSQRIDQIASQIFSFDMDAEVEKIVQRMRDMLRVDLRRRGLVVSISGGIDSSVSAALSVKAVGAARVFGLLQPERDSSSQSTQRGRMLAEHLGIEYMIHDIAPTLEAIGCYRWRDEAIKATFPEYGEGWKNKIVITGADAGQFNHFNLVVADPAGNQMQKRLDLKQYLQIVAATNFKQRIRKTMDFFHADRLNYAVVGTPNRVEYDQGFFVKNGDGSADLKPIAHLYKTQVYMLARHLGLPEEICNAIPTTDTYSLPQGQDEFYYSLPYKEMDIALWHVNNGKTPAELAQCLQISEQHAEYVYRDIESKRRATGPLHWPALLIEPVEGPAPKPSY